MDPQQCLLLETAFEAMHKAGWLPSGAGDSPGKIGVFVGCYGSDWRTTSPDSVRSNHT